MHTPVTPEHSSGPKRCHLRIVGAGPADMNALAVPNQDRIYRATEDEGPVDFDPILLAW